MVTPAKLATLMPLLLLGAAIGFMIGQSLAYDSPPEGSFAGDTRGLGVAGGGDIVLTGFIEIDGSSTVYPLTEYIAERFMDAYPSVVVTVGVSGSGGGFKRFVEGEIQINNASRPIKPEEASAAEANGVRWIEIPVAIDGVVIVVNPGNSWIDCVSIEDLRRLWRYDSDVVKWSDLNPQWPDEKIRLYGPGPDSGTFDYFVETVVGVDIGVRTDYVASEDDNVIVEGVAKEVYALGYFGLAYYEENKDRLKALPVDGGSGCIYPTVDNVSTFRYPLSRPLFIYVNAEDFEKRPEVREFVIFYLKHAAEAAKAVGYVPFPPQYYEAAVALLQAGVYEGLLELATLWAPHVGDKG